MTMFFVYTFSKFWASKWNFEKKKTSKITSQNQYISDTSY